MNPRFLEVLACPVEIGDLKEDIDSVVCTICHRVYPIDQGVIHFVKEEERPHNPKALARLALGRRRNRPLLATGGRGRQPECLQRLHMLAARGRPLGPMLISPF